MGFSGRESSRRLVEKEKTGLFGEGHGHLDLPLISMRKIFHQFVSLLPQIKLFQKIVASLREATIGGEPPEHDELRPLQSLAGHQNIFRHGQVWKKIGDLIRPGNSQCCPAVDGQSGDILLKIEDSPPGWPDRSPLTRLKSVVFPAPFGPIRTRLSPGSILKLTPSTARRPPKSIERSSRTRHGTDPLFSPFSADPIWSPRPLPSRRAVGSRIHARPKTPGTWNNRSWKVRDVGFTRASGWAAELQASLSHRDEVSILPAGPEYRSWLW